MRWRAASRFRAWAALVGSDTQSAGTEQLNPILVAVSIKISRRAPEQLPSWASGVLLTVQVEPYAIVAIPTIDRSTSWMASGRLLPWRSD